MHKHNLKKCIVTLKLKQHDIKHKSERGMGKTGSMAITQEQLIELESKPKTRAQIRLDYFICVLPLICMAIASAEYWMVPDNSKNEKVRWKIKFQ